MEISKDTWHYKFLTQCVCKIVFRPKTSCEYVTKLAMCFVGCVFVYTVVVFMAVGTLFSLFDIFNATVLDHNLMFADQKNVPEILMYLLIAGYSVVGTSVIFGAFGVLRWVWNRKPAFTFKSKPQSEKEEPSILAEWFKGVFSKYCTPITYKD